MDTMNTTTITNLDGAERVAAFQALDEARELWAVAHDRAVAALRNARRAETEAFAQLEACRYDGSTATRALLNQKLSRAQYAVTVALETLKGL